MEEGVEQDVELDVRLELLPPVLPGAPCRRWFKIGARADFVNSIKPALHLLGLCAARSLEPCNPTCNPVWPACNPMSPQQCVAGLQPHVT